MSRGSDRHRAFKSELVINRLSAEALSVDVPPFAPLPGPDAGYRIREGQSGGVGALYKAGRGVCYATPMRERIRKQLREYRVAALDGIGIAVSRTKSKFGGPGRTNSHDWYRAINKDNEAGFAEYMDQSAKFIRQVAPGSAAEYVDELYDCGQNLKREIMAKTEHVAASGNSIAVQLRTELEAALDKLIERKVEDF